MREILFRGKRVDSADPEKNGVWIYGGYTEWGNVQTVITTKGKYGDNVAHEVDKETLCQYIGVTDINNTKIFEGDIVQVPWHKNGRKTMLALVEFSNAAFSLVWKDELYGKHFAGYIDGLEVIGNIFDNPELWNTGKTEFASTYTYKEIEQMIASHLNIPIEWVHLGVTKEDFETDGKKFEKYTPTLTIHGCR